MKLANNILLPVLAVSFFMSSCQKHAPICTGNCVTINANGSVVNKLTSTSASGVPVSLSWVTFSGIFSQSELISKLPSKTDGSFNFTSHIDTSYFSRGYYLSLSVGSSNEYIILTYSGLIRTNTYSLDLNAFQNIQFEVYKKANLKIKLHRTLNDNFQTYAIVHSSIEYYTFDNDYYVESPQEVIDRNTSEIDVATVADVYTRIQTTKTFANGTSTITFDSVKCTSTTTSIYNVSF
jgi:hypothetical protein